MDTQKRRSQFVGTLIGCAVGDALGAPLEGRPREAIAQMDSLTDTFQPYFSYPVGLWHFDRLDRLEKDAEISSIVTHRHPLAIAGAVAIATAVAYAINHTKMIATDFLIAVSHAGTHREAEFAECIQQIGDWLTLGETEALERDRCHPGPPIPGCERCR